MLARGGGPHIIRPASSEADAAHADLPGQGMSGCRRSRQPAQRAGKRRKDDYPQTSGHADKCQRAGRGAARARALTLVRHRTQPTAETVVRLTVTAVFAYLISLTVPGTAHSVLAALIALLVAQVSLYQTLRSAISRVAAVVAGVLLAVGLAALVGFTWSGRRSGSTRRAPPAWDRPTEWRPP